MHAKTVLQTVYEAVFQTSDYCFTPRKEALLDLPLKTAFNTTIAV